jgi:hypothetical protein
MSSAGLIFALLASGVSVAYVLLPMMRSAQTDTRSARARKARDELLTAYERVLAALRDLDEDFQTGKLDAATHQEERGVWMQRGAGLLQQLETLDAATHAEIQTPAFTTKQTLDDPVEAIIARYAQSKGAS